MASKIEFSACGGVSTMQTATPSFRAASVIWGLKAHLCKNAR